MNKPVIILSSFVFGTILSLGLYGGYHKGFSTTGNGIRTGIPKLFYRKQSYNSNSARNNAGKPKKSPQDKYETVHVHIIDKSTNKQIKQPISFSKSYGRKFDTSWQSFIPTGYHIVSHTPYPASYEKPSQTFNIYVDKDKPKPEAPKSSITVSFINNETGASYPSSNNHNYKGAVGSNMIYPINLVPPHTKFAGAVQNDSSLSASNSSLNIKYLKQPSTVYIFVEPQKVTKPAVPVLRGEKLYIHIINERTGKPLTFVGMKEPFIYPIDATYWAKNNKFYKNNNGDGIIDDLPSVFNYTLNYFQRENDIHIDKNKLPKCPKYLTKYSKSLHEYVGRITIYGTRDIDG